jgi:hypothetical protein
MAIIGRLLSASTETTGRDPDASTHLVVLAGIARPSTEASMTQRLQATNQWATSNFRRAPSAISDCRYLFPTRGDSRMKKGLSRKTWEVTKLKLRPEDTATSIAGNMGIIGTVALTLGGAFLSWVILLIWGALMLLGWRALGVLNDVVLRLVGVREDEEPNALHKLVAVPLGICLTVAVNALISIFH